MENKIYVKSPKTIIHDDLGLSLTKNKIYEVIDGNMEGGSFCIFDDKERELYCLTEGCAHLEGDNWILL